MPITALRPRTTTELIDAAFQLLRRHYLQFVSIAAVFLIPVIAINATSLSAPRPTTVPSPGYVLALAAVVVLALLSTAAVVVGVSESYVRDRVEVLYAIRRVLARFLPVIGGTLATLVVLGAILFGLMFGFVLVMGAAVAAAGARSWLAGAVTLVTFAGVALALLATYARIFAVPMVIVLEGASVGAAFARSLALTEGAVWRVMGVFLLVFTIFGALFALLVAVGAMTMMQAPRFVTLYSVLSGAINVFVYPIYTVFITLLYYDLRIRRDGYDLEVMSRELGTTAAQP